MLMESSYAVLRVMMPSSLPPRAEDCLPLSET